jgi:hypothetical protein
MHREEVVAVDAQRRDAAADTALREGRRLAAGDRLEGRDRPLVVPATGALPETASGARSRRAA